MPSSETRPSSKRTIRSAVFSVESRCAIRTVVTFEDEVMRAIAWLMAASEAASRAEVAPCAHDAHRKFFGDSGRERASALIEDKDLRFADERAGDGETLPLAT